MASANTWRDHEGRSRALYERLEVREYWQYDPTGEHLGVRLKGHRLVGGVYKPQPVMESVDGTLMLRSETLGLDLRVQGEEMRFLGPATGRRLLGHQEAVAACQKEAAARRAAEADSETCNPHRRGRDYVT